MPYLPLSRTPGNTGHTDVAKKTGLPGPIFHYFANQPRGVVELKVLMKTRSETIRAAELLGFHWLGRCTGI